VLFGGWLEMAYLLEKALCADYSHIYDQKLASRLNIWFASSGSNELFSFFFENGFYDHCLCEFLFREFFEKKWFRCENAIPRIKGYKFDICKNGQRFNEIKRLCHYRFSAIFKSLSRDHAAEDLNTENNNE
jgi:hypothetical protein